MNLHLRPMSLGDIPPVSAIDRQSFSMAWSARTYEYEISESSSSYMVVLEADGLPRRRRWWRFWQHEPDERIAGFGGLWKIEHEAHISTIAVHPDWRGKGWGEILLAGMMQRAIQLRSHYIGLEVRVSNTRAQNLYHKYAFQIVGVKEGYYHDNDEDAYAMELKYSASAIARFRQQYADLQQRQPFLDAYTGGI